MIEFESRKQKERRKTSCFVAKDRRKPDERRGKALRELEKTRKENFTRHLNAQR